MSRLDDMLGRARDVTVRDDHARRYVAELSRWARPVAQPLRSRLPWLAGGFAIAAAAAAIMLLVMRPQPGAERDDAIRIGERVAIIAEPNTQYRVVAADARGTDVIVERGTVTARLFPGAAPHRLALRGAGVEAVATGTVFALRIDERGASVHVHEGRVVVTRGDERLQVAAGAAWPEAATTNARARDAADRLFSMTLAPPSDAATQPQAADESAVDGAAASPSDDAVADANVATHGSDASSARTLGKRSSVDGHPSADVDAGVAPASDAPPPSLNERYRQARLLRGQGNFDAAIRECLAIADANDATWSPIALLEAARIELGPRASPEQAIVLADRFLADWPSHQLAPEARELRCRALRQLGRDDECKPQR